MKTRRLFFALWPDDATRHAIAFRQQISGIQGRLVARDNLHMTLVFLGEQSDESLDAIGLAAEAVVTDGFTLILDDIRLWLKNGILGLSPSSPVPALIALQASLQHALSGVGFAREKRQFRPHVTLARDAQQSRNIVCEFDPVEWRVEGFSLIESRLRPAGPVYDVIGDWPLRGAAYSLKTHPQ